MRLVLLCALVLAACGGKIDTGGDGGNGGVDSGGADAAKDVQPGADVISPPAQCSGISGSLTGGPNGACTATAEWTCGVTKYTVSCNCPGDSCSCSEQSGGTGGGTIMNNVPSLCPGCAADFATICGFPH